MARGTLAAVPHAFRRRRFRILPLALWANAAAIVLVGVGLLTREGPPSWLPAAVAQQAPAPVAGGAGLFLMPAQLTTNSWGCYVMDVDRQTLMVYQFQVGSDTGGPGRMLKLMAARDFTYDRRLRDFNTSPKPSDIKAQTEREPATKPTSP